MARCGFCGHTNLTKVMWNRSGDGQALENHTRPGTLRQPCRGIQTYLEGAPARVRKGAA